jgi:1,2-diacylglycerol 3-alpha-glucosyltransferase
MTEAKHILILTPGFPSDESDDTCMPYLQTYLKEAVKGNSQLKFSVIALQYPYESKSYLWHGIPVFSCGGSNRSFPVRFYYWRKAFKRLSVEHSRQKIDVVHSLWLSECTLLAQKWTAANNVMHVATAMGQDVLPSNRYLKRINLDKLAIAAVSSSQNQVLKGTAGRFADQIIPWGMDEMNKEESNRSIDVLGVGSLTSLKAFDSFLRIVALILQTNSQLRVSIIGDGPERESLEKLAESLGLKEKVQFSGNLPREAVLGFMQKSKVLLHTSTYESQGFVFNEAMACGMSIVSRKVGLAEESKWWAICEDEKDMAENVLTRLDQKFDPIALMPIQRTVDLYKRLYS